MTDTQEVLLELAQSYPSNFADGILAGKNGAREAHKKGLPLQLPGDILPGDADIIDISTRYAEKKQGKDVEFPVCEDHEVAQALGCLVGYVEERDKLPARKVIRL